MRMPIYYPHFITRSPLHTCDWRWQRAQSLVAAGRNYSRRRDDADTGHAVHYLRALARCRRASPTAPLPKCFDAIHSARSIREGDFDARMTLEARLIAGQTSDEIRDRTGVAADVVDAYERLFFNCRDHFDARDWLLLHCIGAIECQDRIALDRGTVLRCFAFFGGPCVLEAVLPYLLGDQRLLDTPADLSTPNGRHEESIRLAVAFELLPWDAESFRLTLRIVLNDMHAQARIQPRSVVPTLSKSIDKILAELSVAASAKPEDAAPSTADPDVHRQTG